MFPEYHQPVTNSPWYELDDRLRTASRPLPDFQFTQPAYPPFPNPHPRPLKKSIYRSKHRMDYGTALILVLVWCFLLLSTLLLLGSAYLATSDSFGGTTVVTADEVTGIIAASSVPILVATVLNEVLVERSWRRIVVAALGKNVHHLSDKEVARNLRAANFEWLTFLKRFFKCRTSGREWRSLAAYGLLRWGTAISIASVQLCASYHRSTSDKESDQYTINKRFIWLAGPIILHACSVFGTLLLWMMPPWVLLSDRFNDRGLLDKYIPYLSRVQGGSIMSYKDVAEHLEKRKRITIPLGKTHSPGIQFIAKLKGIWFGLVFMCVPPVAAGVFFRFTNHHDVLMIRQYRFIFHFVFLAQNILYCFALDFAVWNVSLEGFCKREGARPNKSLRHLGYSSGIILFFKALRQRKPRRALLFTWLFWIQASAVRFLTVLYTLCITVITYWSYLDRAVIYDQSFWIGWVVMSVAFVLPLFLVWLCTRSEAPVCEQDGWRWAQIAQHGLYGPGFYGVMNGSAVWDEHVERFSDHRGQELR